MSSCTRRSGGGLIESLRRAKSKLANMKPPGASPSQIKAAQNQVNVLQKQLNEKNALKGAQTMFQKANHNAAAVTQTMNAANKVATNLRTVHQTTVTPHEANAIANNTATNAKIVVSQSNELMKLARNAKAIADKLQSLTSGGKRRKNHSRRTLVTRRSRRTRRN